MAAPASAYPLRFDVDYPEQLSRLSTAFRLILVLPIFVLLDLLGSAVAGGLLFAPVLLMVLFRWKYPRWWFDWNREFTRFTNRVTVYFALLRDEYPSTDEQQAVHLDIDYPDVERDLNRWLPLVKWLLVLPHVVVLIVLAIPTAFAIVIAWFAILFTGRYPRGLFNFVVGVGRWALRVQAYALLLVTDRYPPFRLAP